MSTYVIGDIHGEYEQLKILLEKNIPINNLNLFKR